MDCTTDRMGLDKSQLLPIEHLLWWEVPKISCNTDINTADVISTASTLRYISGFWAGSSHVYAAGHTVSVTFQQLCPPCPRKVLEPTSSSNFPVVIDVSTRSHPLLSHINPCCLSLVTSEMQAGRTIIYTCVPSHGVDSGLASTAPLCHEARAPSLVQLS